MTELLRIINSFQKLDLETEQVIEKYFIKEEFQKNEIIIDEDKICSKIYFIKSGLIRRFSLEDGVDVTKWIYTDNQFVTSLSSYFEQKLSFETFQASEQTVVYSLSYLDEQVLSCEAK